jgi:hypothetical protein
MILGVGPDALVMVFSVIRTSCDLSSEIFPAGFIFKIQRVMLLRLGIWRRCWFQAYVGSVIAKACPDFQCFPEADYKVGNNN